MSVKNRPMKRRKARTAGLTELAGQFVSIVRSLSEDSLDTTETTPNAPAESSLDPEVLSTKQLRGSLGEIPAVKSLNPSDPNYFDRVFEETLRVQYPMVMDTAVEAALQGDQQLLGKFLDHTLGKPKERKDSGYSGIDVLVQWSINPFPDEENDPGTSPTPSQKVLTEP